MPFGKITNIKKIRTNDVNNNSSGSSLHIPNYEDIQECKDRYHKKNEKYTQIYTEVLKVMAI